MGTLPAEVLREHIIRPLAAYAPVLRSVCRGWRDAVRAIPELERLMAICVDGEEARGLAKRGYLGLLRWIVEQQRAVFSERRMQLIFNAAAFSGQIEIMRAATAWGAHDVDDALSSAVLGAQLEVVEFLFAAGAKVNQQYYVDYAREHGLTAILHALEDSLEDRIL